MSLRLKGVLGLGLALVGVAIIWAIATPRSIPSHILNPPRIVFISGRDDHGLLENPVVSLYRAPESTSVIANVPDGTFVRVTEAAAEWLHVQTIAAPQAEGWINDYYLRNRALRTDGGGQVEFVDARIDNGTLLIEVRPIGQAGSSLLWLDAALLREIGAREK